jgi:hypothetical protein
MQDLDLFVRRLVNTERTGGRTRHVGGSILVLHDCMGWSHDFTEAVHARFPDMAIDVRTSRNSLSGFVVVFTREGGVIRVRAAWYLAIALGLTSCAYALMASPWWGAYRWIREI